MPEASAVKTETFTQLVMPEGIYSSPVVRRFMAWTPAGRALAMVIGLSVLLYIPYLGAVGLWDPWESHYGEVAREMIQRNDYVFTYWESAPFFSKPPLLMWLDALGMLIVGTNRPEAGVAILTEWGMRLPSAIFSIAALCLLAVALVRTLGIRPALASVFALATMPAYFLLTRQVITDTPFEATFICAMSCAIIGLFDETTRHRSAWWYAFYIFCGLGTLAKELLGVVLPGGVIILYAVFCVLPWDQQSWAKHAKWLTSSQYRGEVKAGKAPMPTLWDYMYRIRFGTGLLLFSAVALPWLLAMIFFAQGRDPENETFVYRYFIHDQIARLARGVFTTERQTPFTYFLQQGGYAIFPWVALAPGALFTAARVHVRKLTKRDQITWIAIFWTLLSFTIVGSSATKFPHYIFPALPGLAILIGLFINDLWEEGFARHAFSLIFGFVLLALAAKDIADGPYRDGRDYIGIPTVSGGLKIFTDMLSFNHDRPYPVQIVNQPLMITADQPLTPAVLLSASLLAVGLFLILRGLEKNAVGRRFAVGLSGAVAIALAIVVFRTPLGADPISTELKSLMNLRAALAWFLSTVIALIGVFAVLRARIALFSLFIAFAVGFALWFSWDHWVQLSHHWTQRDLFWRYYNNRQADEPIAAFQMDWKGETFYSRNTVKQIKAETKLADYLRLPGRKWILVEQGQRARYVQQAAAGHPVQFYDPELNAKLMLLSVD